MLSVLIAAFTVGHAHLSYGQDGFHNGTEKSYITIGPQACAKSVWLSHSKIPRLVSVNGTTFGFTHQNGPENYTRISYHNADKFVDWTKNSFDVDTRHLFKLELGLPTKFADAILYDSGTLTIRDEDGQLQVESVKAMISCNPSSEVSAIGFDQKTQNFQLPDWLIKPEFSQTKDSANPLIKASIASPEKLVVADRIEDTPAPISLPPTLPLKEYVPSYEVQLAAFREENRVLQHLDELRNIVSYIDSYEPEIQSAENPDIGFVYRLRLTNITDKSVALNLCRRLKNDGVDCFVI